jgi:zinc transport system permease protein
MIESLFRYEFLQNAFLTGIFIGFICPLLGVFIVVRRMSLIADALSHVTLAGIAASMYVQKQFFPYIGLNPLYFGMGFSVIGALFIERLRSVYKHYEELAIPIIMSAGIGLGVIFISLADGFNTDLFSYLFGSLSAVSHSDLFAVIIISLAVLGIVIGLFKQLFLLSFDEEYGKTTGLPIKWIHYTFIILVALVIAISMRIVGVLLVSSLITLPVAASIRLSKSFKQTVFLSILFGEISVIGGLVTAYYLDLAPGGSIVMIAVLILIFSIVKKRFFMSR